MLCMSRNVSNVKFVKNIRHSLSKMNISIITQMSFLFLVVFNYSLGILQCREMISEGCVRKSVHATTSTYIRVHGKNKAKFH